MLTQLSTSCKLLSTLCTLVFLSNRRLASSVSILLSVDDLVLCQLFCGGKSAAAVAHVRSSVTVLDEVAGQFRRTLELHVTPAAVEQLHCNNTVHLNRLQLRSRLYVCIEMLGELRLHAEALVADFALIRQSIFHSHW